MAEAQDSVVMTKVSTSNKITTVRGIDYGTAINEYTFVYGKGKNRTSQTRHMTEHQAQQHKKILGG